MPAEAKAGRVIVERYELLDEVGRGPVGVVWRASDRRLQQEVAVREIRLPDVLDAAEQAALAEKVLREAQAAAQLRHPAAVAVLDAVTEDGRPFVVTELVDAPTLEEVVAVDGPLPPERVAAVGLALLDVLGAAHAAGLVHRNVRPSNVLLPRWGGARLADFGVASMIDDPRVTASGAVPAPHYLAPEQTGTAGARAQSDLWSLGATLYFAVEGTPPFDGDDPAATLEAIVGAHPRPALRAGAVQAALDALLVKDPDARADEDAARALLLGGSEADGLTRTERFWRIGDAADGCDPRTERPELTEATGPGRATDFAGPPEVSGPTPATQRPELPELAGRAALAELADLTDRADRTDRADPAPAPPFGDEPGGGGPDEPLEPPTAPGSGREPWFFDIPVETVPPPPLPEPPPPPERPPWPLDTSTGRRFPRGALVTLLALTVGLVLVALVVTDGRLGRSSRSSSSIPRGPSAPDQWVTYTDGATGFSIRHPREWGVRRSGSVTDFVDPERPGTYVRVDHVQPPGSSPEDAWRAQEQALSTRYGNYNRIQIAPSTFQGFPAAIWEFTYTDGGVGLHAVDLGFVTERYGFAINFQARETDWTALQPVFEAFKEGFRPPA